MTTISALPDAPNPLTDSQSAFNSKALALTQALPTFVTQTNAVAGEVNTAKTNAETAETNAETAQAAAEAAQAAAEQAALDATSNGAAQVALATTQANNAATSAASALNAPGTSATSTSTLTIGEGTQSLTIQTGKSISVGQSVTIARTALPTTRMSGAITAYNSGSGALTVEVDRANGSGTYSDWTVSLGVITIDVVLRAYVNATGNVEAAFNFVDTSAGAITLTLPASPVAGDSYAFEDAANAWMTNNLTIARNGNTIEGVAENLICNIDGADFTLWFNGTTWRLA